MPAESKAQRRFFGMVKAGIIKKPKGMKNSEVDKFAKTKEKDLPEKVGESTKLTFKEFLISQE